MRTIIIFIFFIPNAYAIEFVLNGITYNIKEYKITNNGTKLIVNHQTIKNTNKCIKKKLVLTPKIKTRIYRVPAKKKPNAFQRLMLELDIGHKKTKRNYQ